MINSAKALSFWAVLAALLLLGGCVQPPAEPDRILVTVAPISGLVRSVAGDAFPITVLVPAGKEPETFNPTPSEMREIARCALFFRVGLPSEDAVLERLQSLNPRLRVIDLRENLPQLALTEPEEDAEDAHHDKAEHHHHHGGIDPHIWMNLKNLGVMAGTAANALAEFNPAGAEGYRGNAAQFQKRCEELHREISEKLANLPNRAIYVFHPAYGWYAEEFGLQQHAVEAGGKTPKSKDLVDLIKRLREEKAEKIFVQPEFSRSAAETIADSLELNIEVHSPLGEDPLENITSLTDALLR